MLDKLLKIPDMLEAQDKIMTIPNFAIPSLQPKADSSAKLIDRKTIQDIATEIPICPDPVYRPPPKPVKTSVPEIPGCLSDIDSEMNMDFEEILYFKKV